jgi:predicted component of type VI protein secretion system
VNAKLIVDVPSINWACTYLLDEETVQSAGRGKHNAIEIPDLGTSDRHVEFLFTRGKWQVRDVGGEGGLRVNGRMVQESALESGDTIRIGNSDLLFEVEAEEAEEDLRDAREYVREESARIHRSIGAEPAATEAAPANETGWQSPSPTPTRPKILQPLVRAKSSEAPGVSDAADDLVWVSRHLASLLEDVLSKPASLDYMLQRMLIRLREAIGADYGFLMIPEAKTARLVIRTQVGDAFSWSGFERAHPVPLSVTKAAFQRKVPVSNAMADGIQSEDIGPSASMLALNVNGYVAVPLLKGSTCRGVLYFDTRNSTKEFRSRDVKLLEQAGATMVEIEDRKNARQAAV